MPRVQIAENVVPLARATDAKFQAADNGGGLGGAIGAGMQNLANAGADYAGQLKRNQDLFAESTAKQADVMADTQVRATLYEGEGAFYNLRGAAAIDAKGKVVERLNKIRAEALVGLKDPLAKKMFGEAFDTRMRTELVRVAQHEQKEITTYGTQQAQSRRDSARNNALLNVDDPKMFGSFLATGESEIEAEGRLSGWGADMVALKKQEYRSGIHADAIAQRAISDPVGAAAYMVTHASDLTAMDAAKLQQGLRGPLMERQAAADVDGLMNTSTGAMVPVTAPAPTPGSGTTAAQMIAITAFSESRNRETDPKTGKRITSPAGAQGVMQVMPGTQRDPGFGVKPSDGTSEDDARVGRDYLAAMMKRYGNDPAKAWAAYNWGPGNLDNALSKHGADWLSHAPAETRDYVATNMAALGGKRPAEATYAPRKDDLASLYAAIDRQPWDYERKKLAREEVDRRVARDDRLKARDEDDAKDAAYEMVNSLGAGFTSINQIPLNIRNRLSPQAVHSLSSEAEQNAKPKEIPSNGEAVVNLHQLANLEPERFKATDLRLFRAQVTAAEYDQLATLQSSMLKKANTPAQVSHSSIWRVINFYGRDIGVDMGTKQKGESDEKFAARRQDGMRLFSVVKSILDTSVPKDRAPSDDEIKRAFDNAVIRRAMPDGTVVPRYRDETLPTNSIAVPDAMRASIARRLKAAGLPYDDQAVARVYIQGK